MIVVRLRNEHHNLVRLHDLIRADDIRARRVDGDAKDDTGAVERQRRIVDVEIVVRLEVRVERDRPEALLDEAGLHVVAERVDLGQIEKRLVEQLAVFRDDSDSSGVITAVF